MCLPVKLLVILPLFFSLNESEEISNPYSFYLFENMEGCVNNLRIEHQILQQLIVYKTQLLRLRHILRNFHKPKNFFNPIDSYMSLSWNFFNWKSTLFDHLDQMKSLNITSPEVGEKDYHGALNGILLLQDTYEFDVKTAATSGDIVYFDLDQNLKTISGGQPLTKSDLIELAKLAKQKKLYDKAILFLREAARDSPASSESELAEMKEELSEINNDLFEEKKAALTKDYQVLPYFVNKKLQPKIHQPDWVLEGKFNHVLYQKNVPALKEKLFRLFCSRGQFLNVAKNGEEKAKSVLMHHNDPYLKLGPIQTEIQSFYPYRALFHNVFTEDELNWMINHAKPQLTALRQLDIAKKIFDPMKGEKGKRKFVLKTIQTWFNDIKYEWYGNNATITHPEIMKLTKRLELATQLVIGTKYGSTEYQVTHYGLGGLCETHIDPYGYIEGAGLYDHPDVQKLVQTGDIFGTLMGYLNHVEAGGATAFCEPFHEQVIVPNKGSVAFWYSLDTKGHRLPEALHGGCPVLKGSKWIFNKWVHYFDQWKKFPCSLNKQNVFDPPKHFY